MDKELKEIEEGLYNLNTSLSSRQVYLISKFIQENYVPKEVYITKSMEAFKDGFKAAKDSLDGAYESVSNRVDEKINHLNP